MATLPDVNARGKVARDTAANLRRKIKRGKELTTEETEWLAAREAWVASQPKGRPPGTASDADNASQSGSESKPEGGGDNPGRDPSPSPSPESPPPAEPEVPLEAAPKVKPAAQNDSAAPKGDWREEYRKQIRMADDGRQFACEMMADAWSNGLGALVEDMAKAGINPLMGLDPRLPKVRAFAVLAFDEILPAGAKLSPKMVTLAVTTATIGKRAYHHKAITEALKTDPETIAWKKKQAEREAADLANKAAHDAEVAAGKAATESAPQYAAPPPPPDPVRPVNGRPFNTANKSTVAGGIDDDGKGALL